MHSIIPIGATAVQRVYVIVVFNSFVVLKKFNEWV